MLTRQELTQDEEHQIIRYMYFWSVLLLLTVPLSCFISHDNVSSILKDFLRIILSPSKLVTDYFELGSVSASFLNAGLCGLTCAVIASIIKAKSTATLLAGFFLVIAHCFYGLNFLNMWIPFLGIPVYCAVKKQNYREYLHLSFFCTSLGPFISDFLFRYTIQSSFDINKPRITIFGIILAVLFGLAEGFTIPALLKGTTKMHRGFSLFKAGLAVGLFGMLAFDFFYKTLGVDVPDVIYRSNDIYEAHGRSYLFIADIFFGTVFITTLLIGFFKNHKSFNGYKFLFNVDGLHDDFTLKFGMPLTFINIGIYGMAVLLYYNAIILFTEGVGFTGPTVGVIIAAITFSACGQTIKNVWPIAFGYMLLTSAVMIICSICNLEIPATISHQGYINGFAFATGLCPFAGRYGVKFGIIAGILDAIVCTSTSAIHGGFVLYNGGFAAGLTALLLLPVLEFYNVPERDIQQWQ